MKVELPTPALLREVFTYEHATGVLRWNARPLEHFPSPRVGRIWNSRFAHTAAGSLDAYGYVEISMRPHRLKAHRVVWAWVTGEWPTVDIDHINGTRNDNRFCNLRLADRALNNENRRTVRADSKTGLMGVHFHKASGLFQVRIGVRGKDHSLGYFKDRNEAASVYLDAKRRLHEGCTL